MIAGRGFVRCCNRKGRCSGGGGVRPPWSAGNRAKATARLGHCPCRSRRGTRCPRRRGDGKTSRMGRDALREDERQRRATRSAAAPPGRPSRTTRGTTTTSTGARREGRTVRRPSRSWPRRTGVGEVRKEVLALGLLVVVMELLSGFCVVGDSEENPGSAHSNSQD